MIDSLHNLASIPGHPPLERRVHPRYSLDNYEDWPYKIVYANDGVSPETCKATLDAFYVEHAEIPFHRRPNLIHVNGKYGWMRCETNVFERDVIMVEGHYGKFSQEPDADALVLAILQIERRLQASTQILFDYDHILTAFQKRRQRS